MHKASDDYCVIYSEQVEPTRDAVTSQEYVKSPMMVGSDVSRSRTTGQLGSAGIATTSRVAAISSSDVADIQTDAENFLDQYNQRKSFVAPKIVCRVFGRISSCQRSPIIADDSSHYQRAEKEN